MENYAKITDTGKKRVVIIGGGFAGLSLAKSLKKADMQVLLIDKENYHTFQPLLYQVATAGLEANAIIHPFRKIFLKQKNFFFRLAAVERVDTSSQEVETSIGRIRYDYLVIATGATSNFFGDAQMEQHAISMKSIDDALSIRNTLLYNFEKSLQLEDEEERNSLMDYVIVGGGPTGVELAGALSELRQHVFPKEYSELDFREMDIHLIQSGPQLLKGMSEEASAKALEYLENFGVKVWLNKRVRAYDGYRVLLDSGEEIITRTLFWAAGVTGAPLAGIRPESLERGNRFRVDQYNRVVGYPNVFAIGDIAAMLSPETPQGHPMVAQPAMQQGKLLGKNLLRLEKGEEMLPFHYQDQGAMATIGRDHAVADLKLFGKELKVQGFFAWLIWMYIHLFSILGFRDKLGVMINWMWAYFTYDTSNRLIVGRKQENVALEKNLESKAVE